MSNNNCESWIQANINSVLAVEVITLAFVVDMFMLFRDVKTTENLTVMIVTSINALALTVLNYYFGNSVFRTKPPETVKKNDPVS